MRILLIYTFIFVNLGGFMNDAQAQKMRSSNNVSDGISSIRSPKFIESIEIKPDRLTETISLPKEAQVDQPVYSSPVPSASVPLLTGKNSIENATSIQFKYAQLLDRTVELLNNTTLYQFIDEWSGTKYKYGGMNKSGIDCSAFTGLLEEKVFATRIPRTAREQYEESERVTRDELEDGDLVFFNTRGGVSHVGVYLGNGYFVHSSTTSGVTISSLYDPYYEKRFIGGGKISRNGSAAND